MGNTALIMAERRLIGMRDGMGVPLAEPRVALSARTPRSFLAARYPLQSLTRNAAKTPFLRFAIRITLVALLLGCTNNPEKRGAPSELTTTDENLQSARTQQIGAGGIYLGMTLDEAKALYRNDTFSYLPV